MLRVEFLESRETPSLFPTDPIGPITPPASGTPANTNPPPATPPASQGDLPPSNVPPTNPTGPITP